MRLDLRSSLAQQRFGSDWLAGSSQHDALGEFRLASAPVVRSEAFSTEGQRPVDQRQRLRRASRFGQRQSQSDLRRNRVLSVDAIPWLEVTQDVAIQRFRFVRATTLTQRRGQAVTHAKVVDVTLANEVLGPARATRETE